MQIRVQQFVSFAYGDKRKDKAAVRGIIDDMELPYDPAKDRYKQFREAMTSFEDGKLSTKQFLELYKRVSANKSAGYKVLSKNYLDLKEDNALVWQGRRPVEAEIAGLRIATAWYLSTDASNQRRIIFLHFGKDRLPQRKEQGMLTVLRLAKPESAGVGILNIQPGTLTTATRLNQTEVAYLKQRATKFLAIANDLNRGN